MRLTDEVARVRLNLKAEKCKTLRIGHARDKERNVVNGEQIKDFKEFLYFGAK